MGRTAVSPHPVPVRRALSWGLALLANSGLIALILLAPKLPAGPPPMQSIDLVLLPSPQPETEPVVEPAPPVSPEVQPAPETPQVVQPEQRNAVDAAATEAAAPEEDAAIPDDASQPLTATGLPDYGISTLENESAPGETAFVIREVFCLTASEATRDAGHCPDTFQSDGRSMLGYASGTNREAGQRAAIGHGLSPEEMRALFEAEGRQMIDLSGQATLADTSTRSTSSSDDMRDSLPALHPDPAFGD